MLERVLRLYESRDKKRPFYYIELNYNDFALLGEELGYSGHIDTIKIPERGFMRGNSDYFDIITCKVKM